MQSVLLLVVRLQLSYCVVSDFQFPSQSWSEARRTDETASKILDPPAPEVTYQFGAPYRVFRRHNGPVHCVCIDSSKNTELLYSGGQDHMVKIWAKQSGEEVTSAATPSALCAAFDHRVSPSS